MFNLTHWLNYASNYQDYLWIKALLIKETPKAILIEFDNRQIWLPKAWIVSIKRNKANPRHCEPRPKVGAKQSQTEQTPQTIAIKISPYHWSQKAQ